MASIDTTTDEGKATANGRLDYQAERLAQGAACLKAALAYLDRGLSAIPVCTPDHVGVGRAHGEHCQSLGKAPWGPWKQYQSVRATEADLRAKWRENPQLNAGMVYGQVSGIVGVDVDGPLGADAFEQISGGDLPPTWEFRTGGGDDNRRLLYRIPAGILLKTTPLHLGEKQELRFQAEGAQTVMPPSRHKSGKLYAWVPGHSPDDMEPAMAPAWLIAQLKAEPHKTNGKAHAAPAGEVITEGGRNSLLTSLAGTMRRRGMGEEAILAALVAENDEKCNPPLPENELRSIAGSVAKYEPSANGHAEDEQEKLHLTDTGNAKRVIKQFGQNLRHVVLWKKWLCWDGARWRLDDTLATTRCVKLTTAGLIRWAEQKAKEIAEKMEAEADE